MLKPRISQEESQRGFTRIIFRPSTAPGPDLPFGVRLAAHRIAPRHFVKEIRGAGLVLNWNISGRVHLQHEDFSGIYEPGQVFICPPSIAFRYEVVSDQWESRWFELDGRVDFLLPLLTQRLRKVGVCPTAEFVRLQQEVQDISQRGEHLACATAFRILMAATAGPGPGTDRKNPVVRACELVGEQLANPGLNVNWLVSRLRCDRSRFSRTFSEQMGLAPVQYITTKRMQEAMSLLQASKLSIEEIAGRCGYQDVNYFCRAFKKNASMTATEFRLRLEKAS